MPRHAGAFQLVFRKDRGLYYARFRGDDDDLLPWRSTGLTSKTAARAWAQKEIKKGSTTSTRATFAKYAEDWWTTDHPYVQGRLARGHKLTATYLVVMRGHLANHVLPYFEEKRLAQITSRQIEEWLLKLRRERLSPATINHALRCLKVMLKEAARQGIIARDPSAFITGLAERQAERGILTGAEIKAGTKTGPDRIVPLPAFTARYLTELIASSPYQEPGDLVFYGRDRKTPLSPRSILNGFYAALEHLGTDEDERQARRITFHSHRHFLNTALRSARVTDPLVQRVTGHATQEMTEHYSHFALEDYRDVMKVQERLLG